MENVWNRYEMDELEDTIPEIDWSKAPKIYNLKSPGPEWYEERKKRKLMQIIEFYSGTRGNQNGTLLEQMMGYTHGELEMDHDYVQWMFPSNETSMLNVDAPVMTKEESDLFHANPELREKVKKSFIKMLDFFGFYLAVDDNGTVRIDDLEGTEKRPQPQRWLHQFNHNMLRATRVLKCLRLTGLTEYALAFYDALRRHKVKVSQNTFKYWTDAITLPLW